MKTAAIFILLFIILTGCEGVVPESPTNAKETLIIASPEVFTNLDWNSNDNDATSLIATNIMDGLTHLDPRDAANKPIPALASSWDISSDGLKYTFKLRENIKWS